MARRSHPGFLRLVHSDSNVARTLPELTRATPAQDSFLPSSHPSTLIFLAWGKLSLDDLMDVFELSKPKLILDMRVAPRFDLDQLTRRRFFELLRQYDCQYVDLLGRLGVDHMNDALLNPALVGSQAAQFTKGLRVPNSGPLVFIHDDDWVDDDYVSALAKSLPCGTGSSWQVYRPQRSIEVGADQRRADQGSVNAQDSSTTLPLARQAIFISHATPQDNAFVVWLASKLISAGYEVWSDVTNLSGGDGFWGDIEQVIRFRAAKVIFVQSKHVKGKSGARKEVYLAQKVGEKNRLPRFVVPMRIDATPFDETLIELIDLQAIDCRRDWLAGLQSLLALLQRDGTPRATSFRTDQFSNLVSKLGQPALTVVRFEELLVSNLLPILVPPQGITFFSCGGIQSNQMPSIAAQLPIPAFAHYTHIATTATRERFADALASIGFKNTPVGERASLSWGDFLAGQSGDLPGWKRSDGRNNAFNMLRKAWRQHLSHCGASSGLLANNRPFWFFVNQQFVDNKIRFPDFSGRTIQRQLVGYSEKRRVYWHFGAQERCIVVDDQFFFALTPHVIFSADGKTPLSSKAQLHSLRRSFCRSWWNDRWRDLLQGFVAALAGDDNQLKLDIGAQSQLVVAASFKQFSSPISLASEYPVHAPADAGTDEEIEDQWEDDFDEDDDQTLDGLDDLSPPTPQ
jgi:TIR domain